MTEWCKGVLLLMYQQRHNPTHQAIEPPAPAVATPVAAGAYRGGGSFREDKMSKTDKTPAQQAIRDSIREHPSTMHRQGNGWIVSSWDESVECYRESGERDYWHARAAVGTDNCSANWGGECTGPASHHQHPRS